MNPELAARVRAADGGDAETLPAGTDDRAAGTACALHVAGPNGGGRHLLTGGLVSLGRGPESRIVLDDPRASRAHAALHVGDVITLTDVGSVNGTFVEGKR